MGRLVHTGLGTLGARITRRTRRTKRTRRTRRKRRSRTSRTSRRTRIEGGAAPPQEVQQEASSCQPQLQDIR